MQRPDFPAAVARGGLYFSVRLYGKESWAIFLRDSPVIMEGPALLLVSPRHKGGTATRPLGPESHKTMAARGHSRPPGLHFHHHHGCTVLDLSTAEWTRGFHPLEHTPGRRTIKNQDVCPGLFSVLIFISDHRHKPPYLTEWAA